MSFFNGINEEIKALNSDVNNVANSERAKKLRKKLLSIGLPMAIIGWLGVFVCMAVAAISGFSGALMYGPSAGEIIAFVLFMPCGFVGVIGVSIASYGFKIVVTGYATQLIDETVGNVCPKCGDKIDKDEIFCSTE